MKAFKPLHIITILLFLTGKVRAQDSLTVILNSQQLMQGDSLQMEVYLSGAASVKSQTVQLWIENVETGAQWKFRYPLIDGYLNPSLKIGGTVPNGKYALNFLLQKEFFNLDGRILNERYKDKSINYLVVSKNKQTVIGDLPVQPDGSFTGRRFLFQDTAFIIFSPIKRNRENDLNIRIKTSLDSAFTPAIVKTMIISIGKADSTAKNAGDLQKPYSFNLTKNAFSKVLSEVVVVAKTKKIIEQFEKENVSGLFGGGDGPVFDGLSNDDIANSIDIFSFLQSRVAGLQSRTDSETGQQVLMWRGKQTDIFINEIRATDFSPFDINPADIAMIKVFRPGVGLANGNAAGGAVAIYTRRGNYEKPGTRKYNFYIRGYNALDGVWK